MISQTDLKYFLEVAQVRHVSRAAERLGITQPALSHCLKRLELETGHPLFVRSKKGVLLTSAGEKLFEQTRALLQQWDRVLGSIHEDVLEPAGIIQFGCHSAVAQYTLPQILPTFLTRYPKIEFQLHHGLSRHLTEDVVSSKINAAFVVNPVPHPDLVIKELFRDKVTLWKSRGGENMDVLLVEPSLLQSQDILRRLAKLNRKFTRKIESASLEVIAQLLVAGAGCAILPERVARTVMGAKVEAVKDAPVFEDKICLIFQKEFTRTKRGKVFVEHALGNLR